MSLLLHYKLVQLCQVALSIQLLNVLHFAVHYQATVSKRCLLTSKHWGGLLVKLQHV